MQIFREMQPLMAFLVEKRLSGQTVGFVPTMGALHEGHLSLIAQSKAENSLTVCSIFINPAQFNNLADLEKYPRIIEKDKVLLQKAECDILFCPESTEMYPSKQVIKFDFGQLDKSMEGKFRPGHFSGVALVVSKLFNIIEPTIAYFGQKDWQQFTIIRYLVQDLNFNVQLKSVSTVREADGLAMSSRNVRLTKSQRKKAVVLFEILNQTCELLKNGMNIPEAKATIIKHLENDPEIKLEYLEVVDSKNLEVLDSIDQAVSPIICIAANVGDVRLIDNLFYN